MCNTKTFSAHLAYLRTTVNKVLLSILDQKLSNVIKTTLKFIKKLKTSPYSLRSYILTHKNFLFHTPVLSSICEILTIIFKYEDAEVGS